MEGISLDSTALGQLQAGQKELLDTIDDLRKHGVDRFVDLPQIIVVGDQSSGKSSVLEAISRVRFPVKDGLCTRFATELVLRADTRTKVDVKIQPSPSSNRNREAQPFTESGFDKEELPRIIEDAKRKMLVDGAGFSEDVLRIEICGPDLTQLTLVDLPGFYHSEDENQSAAGRQVVDRLAERYMSRSNSIILAIVSAQNKVIMQKVLSKVKEHDKNTERTLGIITKPDLLASGSNDEASFVLLAKNLDSSHKLTLGWHVLRNRAETEQESTDEQRDESEKGFFSSAPWSTIPSRNRGVDALRTKLSKTLLQHIKNNLQALIREIEENLNDRLKRLKRLGPPRATADELRSYLDHIASQFERLSRDAVEGNYSDEFFGGLYPDISSNHASNGRVRKLRALIRDFNRSFAYVLETKGASRVILPPNSSQNGDGVSGVPSLPQYLQVLVDQYQFEEPRKVTFETISVDLEKFSSENQGNEFPGTSNDRIAVQLFQYQSRPWESIAHFHLEVVLDTAKAFVEMLIENVVGPDSRTFSGILREIIHPFFDRKVSELEDKLQELLRHYKSGYPQPLDADFRSALANRRRKNMTEEAMLYLSTNRPDLLTDAAKEELGKIQQVTPTSGFGVEGLIDKAETYYEMSLRTFTDNVIILAIENCLVRDLPNMFTTRIVNRMQHAELERLASESPDIRQERVELQAEYDSLKRGLESCNRYRDRPMTVLPVLAAMDNLSVSPPPRPLPTASPVSSLPSISQTQATPPRTPAPQATRGASASGSSTATLRQNSPGCSTQQPHPQPTSGGTFSFPPQKSTTSNINTNGAGFGTPTTARQTTNLFGSTTSSATSTSPPANTGSSSGGGLFNAGFGSFTQPRATSGALGSSVTSSSIFATAPQNPAQSVGSFGGTSPAQPSQSQQQTSLFGSSRTATQEPNTLKSKKCEYSLKRSKTRIFQ